MEGGTPVGAAATAPSSETVLSAWIVGHLELAVHSFPDRDSLRDLEHHVLARLDPPLNLVGMPSPLHRALAAARQRLVQFSP
jgi:hypothetical protein